MKTRLLLLFAVGSMPVLAAAAADWPQWRGPNRDARVASFSAPPTWPKELTKKWSVTVGHGPATPALVGNKLYTFGREDPNEVVRCLDAATGKELWKKVLEAPPAQTPGPPTMIRGPRSSPTVADGKVVVLGAAGALTCFDASSGQQLWQESRYIGRSGVPRFFTSSSPIVVDGLCIAQLGGEGTGIVAAYDLATGQQKWKWDGGTPAYASPVEIVVAGAKLILAQLSDGIAVLQAADGKHVLDIFFEGQGSRYKAATPIVDGQTFIYSDGNPKAVRIEKQGDKFTSKNLWTDTESRVEFNTPVLKDGLLFGLSGDHQFFCYSLHTGKTEWKAPAPRSSGGSIAGGGGKAGGGGGKGGGAGGKGGKGGGRGGMMGGADGYGSIVDAGSVLFGLTPAGQLVVFQPDAKQYKEVAKYKVADGLTYAYPVVDGNRIYIKDENAVTLWTIE
jgi:outer membrane protein assembly factor BamB